MKFTTNSRVDTINFDTTPYVLELIACIGSDLWLINPAIFIDTNWIEIKHYKNENYYGLIVEYKPEGKSGRTVELELNEDTISTELVKSYVAYVNGIRKDVS